MASADRPACAHARTAMSSPAQARSVHGIPSHGGDETQTLDHVFLLELNTQCALPAGGSECVCSTASARRIVRERAPQRFVVIHEEHGISPEHWGRHGASVRRPAAAGNTTLVLRAAATRIRRLGAQATRAAEPVARDAGSPGNDRTHDACVAAPRKHWRSSRIVPVGVSLPDWHLDIRPWFMASRALEPRGVSVRLDSLSP